MSIELQSWTKTDTITATAVNEVNAGATRSVKMPPTSLDREDRKYTLPPSAKIDHSELERLAEEFDGDSSSVSLEGHQSTAQAARSIGVFANRTERETTDHTQQDQQRRRQGEHCQVQFS